MFRKNPPTSPRPISPSAGLITFTISQYGAYAQVSDVLLQQGFDSPEAIKEAIDPEMLEAENKWREHFDMPKRVDWVIDYDSFKFYDLTPGSLNYLASPPPANHMHPGGFASGMRLTKKLQKAVRSIRSGK